jgi:hypothetical protein
VDIAYDALSQAIICIGSDIAALREQLKPILPGSFYKDDSMLTECPTAFAIDDNYAPVVVGLLVEAEKLQSLAFQIRCISENLALNQSKI